jgi:hypothetical protein
MDSASSSSSSTVDPLVDGVIKGFVCLAGCEDQLTAFGAACFPKSDDDPAATPTPDAQACAFQPWNHPAFSRIHDGTSVVYLSQVRHIFMRPIETNIKRKGES